MAVHVVLCSFVWAAISFVSSNSRSRAKTFVLCLIAASMLAVGLAAVQILPSKEWSDQSDRALRNGPRSFPELLADYSASGEFDTSGFWRRDTLASEHASKTYNFSVGPWRWNELFWPNVSGHFAPISTRWIRALPGEGRMWTASLYLGLLPICLAVFRWRLFRGSVAVRWISWLALLSIFAALGEYGIGWLMEEYRFQVDGEQFTRSPIIKGFGGLYWFLTATVPGYADFRYPGKWWTVSSLGICVLAAKGWPVFWSRYRKDALTRFTLCGISTLAVALVCRFFIVDSVPASSVFGPFDEALSLRHLFGTLLHVIVCAIGFWLLTRNRKKTAAVALLLLSTIELTVAQQPLVHSAAEYAKVENPSPGDTFWREATPMYPQRFRNSSSVDRFTEMREHDIQTLMPKHHLLCNKRQLNSISSMHCADYHSIWTALEHGQKPTQETLHLLGAANLPNESPTAWLVFQWKGIPSGQLDTLRKIEQRTRNVLLTESGELIDHQNVAIIETDDEIPEPPSEQPKHDIDVVATSPTRLEVLVNTESRALLVFREQFYPGWNATITNSSSSQNATIHRTNRVMRGVFVEPGKSTVVLRYQPRSFYLGATMSAASWLALMAFCLRSRLRRTDTKSES